MLVSFHSNPKEGNAKECSKYCTIALISHASEVMLKILQARLQWVMVESSDSELSQIHSFLWLSNIPLCICTITSLSIHLSMDI